jgi:hypothetical protein
MSNGRYLVNTILACGNCHTPKTPDGAAIPQMDLAGGGLSFTTLAFNATAANITPDRETGIDTWSDDDIKRALTEGVRPTHARVPGALLAAVMPAAFYKAILPADLGSIVAYLRSVKPVRNEVPAPTYKSSRALSRRRGRIHRSCNPRSRQARGLSGYHRPLQGMPFGFGKRRAGLPTRAWQRGPSNRADPRSGISEELGRGDTTKYHVASAGRYRRLERRGDQARDHVPHALTVLPHTPSSEG